MDTEASKLVIKYTNNQDWTKKGATWIAFLIFECGFAVVFGVTNESYQCHSNRSRLELDPPCRVPPWVVLPASRERELRRRPRSATTGWHPKWWALWNGPMGKSHGEWWVPVSTRAIHILTLHLHICISSLLFMLLCFSALPASFLFFSASLLYLLLFFSASLLSLLLCFCASAPFYFYYSNFFFSSVMCFCCSTSCSSASLLPVFTASLFFSFLLLYSLPKWNPKVDPTVGETQRNPKEILIRTPDKTPRHEPLNEASRNPKWNPNETINETPKKLWMKP